MEEENSFDVKYKEVIDFIKKIKSIKQEKEGNKMIKELEKEIDITYTSKEQNEMKRKVNECKYKLNDMIEEIRLTHNTSKLNITFNQSSMSKLYNNPENNVLAALNSKKNFHKLKEEMGIDTEDKSKKVEISFHIQNNNKTNNKTDKIKNNKSIILVSILAIVLILFAIFIFFKAKLIPSNGTLITVLIPLMRAFITAFNPFKIPSFMHVNTFPPVLNTSFTFCQAFENLSLNQSAILPKGDLILSHTFLKNSLTFSTLNVFLIFSHAPSNLSLNHSGIVFPSG